MALITIKYIRIGGVEGYIKIRLLYPSLPTLKNKQTTKQKQKTINKKII